MWVRHSVHAHAVSRGRKSTPVRPTRPKVLQLQKLPTEDQNLGLVLSEWSWLCSWTLLSGTPQTFSSQPLIGREAAVARSRRPAGWRQGSGAAIAAASFKPQLFGVKLGGIRRARPLLTIFISARQLRAKTELTVSCSSPSEKYVGFFSLYIQSQNLSKYRIKKSNQKQIFFLLFRFLWINLRQPTSCPCASSGVTGGADGSICRTQPLPRTSWSGGGAESSARSLHV